ncbi:MAG: M28 family peptidase, partial [Gemmatimonadales bacterium]
LMTRIYQFADDSFLGRAVGTESNNRATAYIEREARRIGLLPGGERGSYFQDVPVVARGFDTTSTLSVGSTTFHGGSDFLMQTQGALHDLHGVRAVYGGASYDTTHLLPIDSVHDRVLVLSAAPLPANAAFMRSNGLRRWLATVNTAAAVVDVGPEEMPVPARRRLLVPSGIWIDAPQQTQLVFLATPEVADAMLGTRVAAAAIGAPGALVSTALRRIQVPLPGRNVIAILPGDDPSLRGEYVELSAHSDFLAPIPPRDADSLRAYNTVARPMGAASPPATPTDAQWSRIFALIDSARRQRPRRADSIYNGADDSGSGSMSLLELAEALKGQPPLRRSLLFVWHTGQEPGDWGSRYFTDRPTVPLDSIVVALDVNSIGRGAAADVTGTTLTGAPLHGSENYLQVIGARRTSAEIGDLIDRADADSAIVLDSTVDEHGHPARMACRGDRVMYEAHGVPAVWFTTGTHADFRQVTDDPQFIDYRHLATIDRFLLKVVTSLADLDHRPATNHPRPAHWSCQQ